ncbi:unnamed protein product [Rodentolepis nana]|uniref:Innexin n=1 Tax=Rodentolepis nana TaxID=102285 RepID=A0A0R3TDA8_RODNA|nr:unnamed protein product [Rodentolepis nana]
MTIPLLGGLQELFRGRHGSSNDNFATLEDLADRLNRFYSMGIITICAGITMTSVYFLRPITCTSSEYPTIPNFFAYIESICWTEGTIDLRKSDRIPNTQEEWDRLRGKADISFYQWVPFCLAIQAILFFLPHLLWQSLTVNTLGDDFGALIARAKAANTTGDADIRTKLVRTCADQLFRVSRQHSRLHSGKSFKARLYRFLLTYVPGTHLFVFGKRLGNRTAFYYLIIKLLYIVNCVGQIFLIMLFLSPDGITRTDFIQFTLRLFNTLVNNREWKGSDLFPMRAICPVSLHILGHRNQLFTAICALPINMLNEKIYIFLFVWLLFVLSISVFSTLVWMSRFVFLSRSVSFLTRLLNISQDAARPTLDRNNKLVRYDKADVKDEEMLKNQFVREIGLDGYFMIQMLKNNAGDVVSGEILLSWWKIYQLVDRLEHEVEEDAVNMV